MRDRSAVTVRLGILGNPANRRVTGFQRVCPAECVSWEEFLADPDALQRLRVDRLRIDSPGEDEAVARALIARGGGPAEARLERGEIAWLREYHRGFCAALAEVRGFHCLNDPADIAAMFDKWECHRRFTERGLARPPAFLAAETVEELLSPPEGRLFLKPLHGSSASGVCALRWTRERVQLIAPLQRVGSLLLNSLRVCRYESPEEVRAILSRLLPQGMIAERWIPKLSLPGGAVDLRVLVIAGEARHRVARQGLHPMTNLHLGNRRLPEAALEPSTWSAAVRLAEEAAACFPDSLYAGVDILLDARGRPLVGEINAFGDLLPGLEHRGETAYEAIAAACSRKAVAR